MILAGKEIKRRLGKDLFIEPFDDKYLNPNSYNLRLYNELLIYDEVIIEGEYERYCSGKYQNSTGVQPSLLYKDFEKSDINIKMKISENK